MAKIIISDLECMTNSEIYNALNAKTDEDFANTLPDKVKFLYKQEYNYFFEECILKFMHIIIVDRFKNGSISIDSLTPKKTFYKILHKPTGLYFTPSRGHGNLSSKGKVYANKPNLDRIDYLTVVLKSSTNKKEKLTKKQRLLVDFFNIQPNPAFSNHAYWVDKSFPANKSDLEIVEV